MYAILHKQSNEWYTGRHRVHQFITSSDWALTFENYDDAVSELNYHNMGAEFMVVKVKMEIVPLTSN